MLLCIIKSMLLQRHESLNNVLTEFNLSVMLGVSLDFFCGKLVHISWALFLLFKHPVLD